MQSVRAARAGASAAPQAPGDAAQVAPGELRAAQAERLDEEHPVAGARRAIRWCWLVHSSVSQSAKPTQTISRPRSCIGDTLLTPRALRVVRS